VHTHPVTAAAWPVITWPLSASSDGARSLARSVPLRRRPYEALALAHELVLEGAPLFHFPTHMDQASVTSLPYPGPPRRSNHAS
jgi:hypothetical protein